MNDKEKLSCLTDRPCTACKFHKEEGCSKWSCIFEEKSDVPERDKGTDLITLNAQGLDEGIRCAMCTNSMANDRGCDGGCVVDTAMYGRVLKVIKECTVPERENGTLEKIKAEIQDKGFNSPLMNPVFTMTEILEIIDKYMRGGKE